MDKDALRSVFSYASRDGWSLRSDIQLQEWLEDFSERLKKRTKEVAAEVHRLRIEAGNVELLLQNNYNSLRALSATQFIENRVDEVDEVFVNKSEQPIKQSRVESYDSQIIPRYKEAVLTAWDAFEGFRTRKTSRQSSDTKPSMKLPHIIGTEELARDNHCDIKVPEVNARAPSSEPVESDSDTDRDEVRMAAEMVGGRTWLEGEWLATESKTSGHQGGVLEPAVSAALDFKAMLEAALRGPSFPYEGMIPNLENAYEQHSYVGNSSTLAAHDTDSNTPSVKFVGRTRSSPEEIRLDSDSSTKHGQTPLEHSMQYQNQELASEALGELKRTLLLQPTPIPMSPAFRRMNFAHVAGSMGPKTPSISTPISSSLSPLDEFPDDPGPSPGRSSRSDSPTQGVITSTAKIQNETTAPSPRTEENKSQPASEYRPSGVPDDLPMPTLPDGLFQGLQSAFQARQLRSQKNEVAEEGKEAAPKLGEGIASVPAESRSFSVRRASPLKLNLKDNNRGFASKGKSKVETSSKLQQKGLPASKRTPGPISFQGGLFDDDDDVDDIGDFLSKESTLTPQNGTNNKMGEHQSSPLTGPLTSGSSSSMVRKGLFDDFGDLSMESPSEPEVGGAGSSGLGERDATTTTQKRAFSFPDRKDASRSRVLQKSLFGDSDEEEDLFGE